MDYKTYITKVEEHIENMTNEQKSDWIFSQARIVDEMKRQGFLNSLIGTKELSTELTIEAMKDWCKQVEDGAIYFATEYFEYYEEGAWDSDCKVVYKDISDAMPYLEKVIRSCYQLVMLKEYREAYQLIERVCRLEFHVEYDSEYDCRFRDDDQGLVLEVLCRESLISIDFHKLSLNLLYACYQACVGYDRLNGLYIYLAWDMCNGIKMTDVFAYGSEKLEGTEPFMAEWSEHLARIPSDRAAELLVDACIFLGNDDYLLEMARRNVNMHPYLYKAYCERKSQSEDYAACINIAKEAIRQIDKNKAIRADISDMAVEAAKKLDGTWAMIKFYWAAFYSKPNSWHLLRLFMLQDKAVIDKAVIDKALDRVKRVSPDPRAGNMGSKELQETTIQGKNLKLAYQLLLGDYEHIIREYGDNKEYPITVPLLLIYLKEDKSWKTQAERNLISNLKYMLSFEGAGEHESFDDYLSVWRREYSMPEKQRLKCILWLKEEVNRRTEDIVGGGHRSSYNKAAELIVVMGAIMEEQGEINGMQSLIDFYKKQHSRKIAFKSEIDGLAKHEK